MYRYVLPLLLFLSTFASAQKSDLTRTLGDTIRVDVLLDSAKGWVQQGDVDRPVTACEEALTLLTAIDTVRHGSTPVRKRMMQAYKLQGVSHHHAGRSALALDRFRRMQEVSTLMMDARNTASALIYQGYQHRTMTDLEQARAVTEEALRLLQGPESAGQQALALAAMGNILTDLQQPDSALHYHRQAVQLLNELGYAELEASSRMDIAAVSSDLGRFDEALKELGKARPVLLASPDITQHIVLYVQEARALIGLGRYQEAANDLELARPIAAATENDESKSMIYHLLALAVVGQGRPDQALPLMDSSRAHLIRSLDLEKARALTEVRLQAEHEQERQEAAAALTAESLRRRNTLIGGGVALIIAALLAWLLFTTRRKNTQILEAQQQVVEVEKQRENEQVRTRIARDIHDEIGSGLTKIALLGSDAKRRVLEHSDELRTTLERIIDHSREVSAALSDIVWSVDPEHDTSLELVNHASLVAHRLLDGSGVAHELHFDHIDPAHNVAPGTKHHVVMVMKEAINNALKYAEATRITVQLQAGAHHVKLVVTDNGKGFDPQAMARAGNGLRNMRTRAESTGASLTVESAPGKGCTVRLEGVLS